ncbi:galactokinase [Alkalihalobacillus sp. AL-G]|uniref:galactokinase n=1 Tax=Alkalihalobacillus sp. AL-G TaxID=2926399 RepID=UPI00272C80C3|nr:galactokinase [Alkalihalobacillus sp. AL-G]WLD92792.1 galactokinase [Alkalihalobacillus sp. AL-G]
MLKQLKQEFHTLFKSENQVRTFFAPGRVNLIGEHTDYNGGHVFPCALSVGTYAIARLRSDKRVRMFSKNFPELGVIDFEIGDIHFEKEHDWANYPKGVMKEFQKHSHELLQGCEVLFYGNIPNGAGLSSSASIELVTAVMINNLYSIKMEMIDLVKISQYAENDFVGVSCGIMDQFAIGMGKKEHAILLNSETLAFTYSPVKLTDASLVITNSNKRRGLADSKYNERRYECEQALNDLKKQLDIQTLSELSASEFENFKGLIRDDVHRKRARHVVYENQRTKEAVRKLKENDVNGFGELMNESHHSLRDDYEVTGVELDVLVETAWDQDGVLGSRMTGAGFGGCTISIVRNNQLTHFKEKVYDTYLKETGLEADFYDVNIGDGARELVE